MRSSDSEVTSILDGLFPEALGSAGLKHHGEGTFHERAVYALREGVHVGLVGRGGSELNSVLLEDSSGFATCEFSSAVCVETFGCQARLVLYVGEPETEDFTEIILPAEAVDPDVASGYVHDCSKITFSAGN